jgi:hypothetical protein
MNNLASTYRDQGRWEEAEELEVQVMETSLRVIDAEHPDTLTSMANLASTYGNQGRWKEAEELDVLVMETSLRVLGAEHLNTLMASSKQWPRTHQRASHKYFRCHDYCHIGTQCSASQTYSYCTGQYKTRQPVNSSASSQDDPTDQTPRATLGGSHPQYSNTHSADE